MNTNFLEKVKEFHELFNHPVGNKPANISENRKKLRYKLLYEEVEELNVAMSENNLTEVADALGDILYVLGGAIIEHGLQNAMPEIFAEIHRSNMSKLCNSTEEVYESIENYTSKDNSLSIASTSVMTKEGKKWILIREDNKILKNINYSPANLKPIIEKYQRLMENPKTPNESFENKDGGRL